MGTQLFCSGTACRHCYSSADTLSPAVREKERERITKLISLISQTDGYNTKNWAIMITVITNMSRIYIKILHVIFFIYLWRHIKQNENCSRMILFDLYTSENQQSQQCLTSDINEKDSEKNWPHKRNLTPAAAALCCDSAAQFLIVASIHPTERNRFY